MYSVDDLFPKDNLLSAIVLAVIQIHFSEFQFKIIAHWCMLQNIIIRTVAIVLSSRVILETVYFIIYVLPSASQLFFCKVLCRKRNYFCAHNHCNYHFYLLRFAKCTCYLDAY